MTYTSEEKMNIINRTNRGNSIRALCAEYGISRSRLYRWAGDYREPDSDSGKNHNIAFSNSFMNGGVYNRSPILESLTIMLWPSLSLHH